MLIFSKIDSKKYKLTFIRKDGTELTWEISEKLLRELMDGLS